jgi:S-DNA-T family DNA segregation ATPase FtsK/SpoIIIE
VRVVLDSQRGSVSLLQRRLNIGYARASRIIEVMAAAGILGEYKGSQAREVLMTLKEYEQMQKQAAVEISEYQDEDSPSHADNAKHYEGSAEGEYHYAAVENQD